jgi:chloramphenicol 3-O phosphotransferase
LAHQLAAKSAAAERLIRWAARAPMPESTEPGKIILIHGASSSGKTTLSRALQRLLDEPFMHFSIDVLRENGALPMERIREGEFGWRALRPSFFDGFHRCLPALAEAGNNLIVEHIVESEEWMTRLVGLLAPYDVFFVVLHCALATLEQREIARGDRRIGESRDDFQGLPRFAACDLTLDSTEPLEQNVRRLISSWEVRERPSAFTRLAGSVPAHGPTRSYS